MPALPWVLPSGDSESMADRIVALSAAGVGGIDLHAGKEREDNRGELRDEVEPFGRVQVENVPDDDAKRQLDQSDGDAELNRNHRGDENHRRHERYPHLDHGTPPGDDLVTAWCAHGRAALVGGAAGAESQAGDLHVPHLPPAAARDERARADRA